MSSKIQYYPNHRQMLLSILKVFYDPIHLCLMNVLMHHNFLTDKQIAEKTNMDVPSIRSSLNKLLQDKLVQHKMKVQTEQDKTIKHDLYYINMKLALNSFMYRLYNTRKKLEEEKERSFMAGRYHCINVNCGEFYDDHDIVSIHDQFTGTTICQICGGSVEPVEDTQKRREAREEVGRFNDKIYNPFLELYNNVKKDKLDADMIQPDFDEFNSTGDTKKNSGLGTKMGSNTEIIFNNDSTWSDGMALGEDGKKENPSWLYSEAVVGLGNSSANQNNSTSDNSNEAGITQMMAPGRIPGALTHITELDPEKEIMEMLMSTEYVIENSLSHHLSIMTHQDDTPFISIRWPTEWELNNNKLARLLYNYTHDSDVSTLQNPRTTSNVPLPTIIKYAPMTTTSCTNLTNNNHSINRHSINSTNQTYSKNGTYVSHVF